MSTDRVHPETLAGDPFAAVATEKVEEHPHACWDGWVTIGQMVLDAETGEEVEEFATYLCRRCSAGEPR